MSPYLSLVFGALFCVQGVFFKEIPPYIHICKRDQKTVDSCVHETIETLRPKLAVGIPELKVPGIDPFYIPELKVIGGDLLQASGKNVKVTGAGNFTLKSISVDLNTLNIKARVRFPKLHFEGQYKIDAKILVVPLHGQGNIIADAVKTDAELNLRSKLEQKDGVEYLKFTAMDAEVSIKDYRLRLEGLFNGDKVLGEAANRAINDNRQEFLVATKPYVEKTVAKILLDSANKIVDGIPFDKLLPKP